MTEAPVTVSFLFSQLLLQLLDLGIVEFGLLGLRKLLDNGEDEEEDQPSVTLQMHTSAPS
eukprot:2695021-Karenia_brevis.AAC.1